MTAASLGCRFGTAYRAVVAQGRLARDAGQWLAVHGCGGVGLSAVMIGSALGARVLAVDIDPAALALAQSLGAEVTVDARQADVVGRIRALTDGGAHISLDAFGSRDTCLNSISGLRSRGRHVQVGLLAGAEANPPLPMGRIIGAELEVLGSHGIQASRYPEMLDMIAEGKLRPERLVARTVELEQAAVELAQATPAPPAGVTIIDMAA